MLESSRSGYAVQELMSETEVSDKPIRRDLKVLQTVFNVTERTGDGGVKRWQMTPLAEQVGFNYTELLSIHMSQQLLEPLAGTPFFEGTRSVLRKVKGAIGNNAARYIEKLSAGLHSTSVGASDYSHRGEMIDQLMVAIEDRKVTLVVYQSMQATEAVEQELYPLGISHHRGSLYLIAWSARREEVRNFKVDRIESVDVQNLQYQVPTEFNLQDWLSKSFGVWRSGEDDSQLIRVQFKKSAARYVQESTWHSTQRLYPQPDGTLIAEFQLPDIEEILKWVLSFGSNATALEPSALVERISEEVQQMLKAYETKPGKTK